MKINQGQLLYSAADVVNFLACKSLTAIDAVNLKVALPKAEEDPTAKLLQDKGFAHESAFLAELRKKKLKIAEIPQDKPLEQRAKLTIEALKSGVDVVFQAAFLESPWFGYADFLIKRDGSSALGSFGYEVYDTKLARQAAPRFLVQLAFYNDLLATIQGRPGDHVHVVLGDNRVESFWASELDGYVAMAKARFAAHAKSLAGLSSLEAAWARPDVPYPAPCEKCGTCRWTPICEKKRLDDDHLSQVAGIRKTQIAKLESAGIQTLAQLAATHGGKSPVTGMNKKVLKKLAHQAALQQGEKTSGRQEYCLLPPFDLGVSPGRVESEGLILLPRPDAGDIFFDMEGDPLEDGGLEYLFGAAYYDAAKLVFRPFWAHTRAEEKAAFEQFIDFVTDRIGRFPGAHIYHYAPYEVAAMRRLASRHATREKEVDDLLRQERFVDLYRVVRDSILISKDSYSIKKVEAFYRSKRSGDVKKADESIVVYEQWKVSRDPALLQGIEDYNKEDCFSTVQLRDWLLSIAPAWIPAKSAAGAPAVAIQTEAPRPRSERALQEEAERAIIESQLLAFAHGQQVSKLAEPAIFDLLAQLLAFHIREKKPMWWSLFDRQGAELEDLLRDEEIIAGCELSGVGKDGSATIARFRFPEQDFRLEVGDSVKTLGSLRDGEVAALDEAQRLVTVSFRRDVELSQVEHIVQCADVPTSTLGKAIVRFAQALVRGDGRYKALLDYLSRRSPDIQGIPAGGDLLGGGEATVDNAWKAVSQMKETTLYIQGPPGAGKTYTGSHLIARLVRAGKKVAICSNSHKAVNHLMIAAHDILRDAGHPHVAMKKASSEEQRCDRPGIQNLPDDKKIISSIGIVSLVGGVAWTYCKDGLDRAFDYLFVDEAGQVSVANLIAAGVCAKNIVLLGDQMQLGQPIQAAHPGRSGESALDYLLDGQATIQRERGIFLDKTFRMHPDLCKFVSDCFYEGRLLPDASTAKRRLILGPGHHAALAPAGLVMHAVNHAGCTQRSAEEAEVVKALLSDLLRQRYLDKDGAERAMTIDDVLVVAPYNAQVSLLKRTLPKGARVGTVDKFQGQEAQVVIVSMTSSTTDDSPRGTSFLLDRNRLNVAVSRAKALSIMVCSPGLLEGSAKTVEDVFRLNVIGRAKMGAR